MVMAIHQAVFLLAFNESGKICLCYRLQDSLTQCQKKGTVAGECPAGQTFTHWANEAD